MTLTLASGRDCTVTGAPCTADGKTLSAPLTVTVPGPDPEAPLTATIVNAPSEHSGASSPFQVTVSFTEDLRNGYAYVYQAASATEGATVTASTRHRNHETGEKDKSTWHFTVEPTGNGPVTFRLTGGGPPCTTWRWAVPCTRDGRVLSNAPSVTIQGPAGISVADAEATEGTDPHMTFTVTLSRPALAPVSVDYATADGTATQPDDYTETSGTLTFSAGQRSKTVRVPIVDDSLDDDGETFTLTLSNPTNGHIADGTATGTIRNTDPIPQAWIARFGRTVAEQVIDAVESRMRAPRTPGAEASIGGQRIGLGPVFGADAEAGDRQEAEAREARREEADAAEAGRRLAEWIRGGTPGSRSGAGGAGDPERRPGAGPRTMTQRDLVLGSSFALTAPARGGAGGAVSLWGRAAVSRFDGRQGGLAVDGEVTSGLLGADWSRDRTTAGLILGHSRGEGGYRSAAANPGSGAGTGGAVASTLTGLYPWGRYALTERISVWGVAGYGEGTLTLTPEGPDGESRAAIRTGLDLILGAAGLRGVLVQAPETGGPELAVKTDAMGVRTTSAKARGLSAAEADVTRLRLGLEGSWAIRFEGGGALTPSIEIGVRHDGGDAETGYGADIGGGIAWSDPKRGLSAELRGRGLLSHEAKGFRERGLSGTLAFDPAPDTDRGLNLSLSQTVGARAAGGMDALLQRGTMTGLAANDNNGGGDDLANRRFEMKLGYGLPASGDRFTATPEAGAGLWNGGRDYSLGWRLTRENRGGIGALELALEARRQENDNRGARPEHLIGLRVTARW